MKANDIPAVRIIAWSAGAAFYALYVNLIPLFIAFQSNVSTNLVLIILFASAIGAWLFSLSLESTMRRRVSKLYLKKIQANRVYASPAFEGTHFGGAIEKYVWSATDLIKESIVLLTVLVGLLFANWMSALLLTALLIASWNVGKKFLRQIRSARLQLSRKRRQLTDRLVLKDADNRDRDHACKLYNAVNNLGEARIVMQKLRSVLAGMSAIVAFAFLSLAIVMMQQNFELGLWLLIVSLRATQDVSRIIEVLVIWLGERIHMEKLK